MTTLNEKWVKSLKKSIQDKIDVLTHAKESLVEKCDEVLTLGNSSLHSTSVNKKELLSTCNQMDKLILHLSDCQQHISEDTPVREEDEISSTGKAYKITDGRIENLIENFAKLEEKQAKFAEEQSVIQEQLAQMSHKVKTVENRDNNRIGEIKNMKKKIEEIQITKEQVKDQKEQMRSCFSQIHQLDNQLKSCLNTEEKKFKEIGEKMNKFMNENKIQKLETKRLFQEMSEMKAKIKTENHKFHESITTMENEITKVTKETENLEKQQSLTSKKILEFDENVNKTKQMEENIGKIGEKSDELLALMEDKIRPLERLRHILSSAMCTSSPTLGSLSSKVEKLEADIGQLTKLETFAFTVGTGMKQIVPGAVISGYFTLTNKGTMMNPNTGRFTAPVKGTYCFIIRVRQDPGMVIEGPVNTLVWAKTPNGGTVEVCGTKTDRRHTLLDTNPGLVELEQGDQAFFKVENCPNDVSIHTRLSGWLVK